MKSGGKNIFDIVVVEDNPADVYLIKQSLKEQGLFFNLTVFDNGEDALAHFRKIIKQIPPTLPHLILLDLNLPKLDGKLILKELFSLGISSQIPVLVFSSSNAPDDEMDALQLGAKEYHRKSPALDEFMKIGKVISSLLATSDNKNL